VSHISFPKKCVTDTNHVIDWNVIQVEKEDGFQVHLMHILDQKIKKLQNQSIWIVKVQWAWYDPEDETWENEYAMWTKYLHILENF
jgi:hypothetical protein